ncbi:MAG: non-homologous end-joining DNA ligase [Candidatus Bathyarchaeota archaeon]|nr:non-homologous end-joining DNA ligase [Candidatus Bathyarchaeota archaeon]
MTKKLTKVKFSNLSKTLFPKLGITKAKFIEYYIKIAPKILPFLVDRPLVLTRYPNGVDKEGFYEKDAPKGKPDWVKTATLYSQTAKRDVHYVLCNDLDTLIWLANLAAVELHMPLSRANSREMPDFAFFDLDPEPPAAFADAVEVGLLLKEKLDDLGLLSYVKTSGKKGLHVLVPVVNGYDFKKTRAFVHSLGQQLTKELEVVVSEFKDTKKPGKVFVDYTQNSHGRTMACPYSLRANNDASVSTPLDWKEVKKSIKPSEFNIHSIPKINKDPWEGIFENRQKLEGNS